MEYNEDFKINYKVYIAKKRIDLLKFVFCTKNINTCFILRKFIDCNKKIISTFVLKF